MLVVVATTLVGATLATTPASASSGGGCGTFRDNVEACISASGSSVNFDVYTGTSPWDCTPGQSPDLGVSIEIVDTTSGKFDRLNSETCLNNHHYGVFSVAGLNGHQYYTIAYVNGYWEADSEVLTFSN